MYYLDRLHNDQNQSKQIKIQIQDVTKLEHEPGTPSRNEASEVEATPLKLFAGKDESSALQMKQQSASHQSAGALSPGYVSSP